MIKLESIQEKNQLSFQVRDFFLKIELSLLKQKEKIFKPTQSFFLYPFKCFSFL